MAYPLARAQLVLFGVSPSVALPSSFRLSNTCPGFTALLNPSTVARILAGIKLHLATASSSSVSALIAGNTDGMNSGNALASQME